MLGKQFIPGLSSVYIILTIELAISVELIVARTTAFGNAINIIPAIIVVMIKVAIYLKNDDLFFKYM